MEEMKREIEMLKKRFMRQERAFKKIKKLIMPENEKKPRKPSGFALPTLLSDELCEFLNLPIGSYLPRTEVTKQILGYVKEKSLQNPEAKKYIILDDKLSKLLKPEPNFEVSYFNIQKLLKLHYKK